MSRCVQDGACARRCEWDRVALEWCLCACVRSVMVMLMVTGAHFSSDLANTLQLGRRKKITPQKIPVYSRALLVQLRIRSAPAPASVPARRRPILKVVYFTLSSKKNITRCASPDAAILLPQRTLKACSPTKSNKKAIHKRLQSSDANTIYDAISSRAHARRGAHSERAWGERCGWCPRLAAACAHFLDFLDFLGGFLSLLLLLL